MVLEAKIVITVAAFSTKVALLWGKQPGYNVLHPILEATHNVSQNLLLCWAA